MLAWLRRVRTRGSRTSSQVAMSLFILFCLSKIRADDASGLEGPESVPGLQEEKAVCFSIGELFAQ